MKQEFTSARTSINSKRPPAVFKKVKWVSGTINFDNGGGKFDIATECLAGLGVKNVIYDKFNRSLDYNAISLGVVRGGKANTSTIANVLNVVKEPEIRQSILQTSHDALCKGGLVYVWVYEGDKSGIGKAGRDSWQENRIAKSYVDEIANLFEVVEVKGINLIIGRKNNGKEIVRL